MTTPLDQYAQPAPPTERVLPGLLLSLVAIPVGVVLWVIIWNFGFVSALVGFAIAGLAVFLYKKGSGGPIGLAGIVGVVIITLVALMLSFVAGLASDYSRMQGLNLLSALGNSEFWSDFGRIFFTQFKANLPNFGFALLAGFIGIGAILRTNLTNKGRGVNLNMMPADMRQYFNPPPAAPGTETTTGFDPEPGTDAAAPVTTPGVPPVPPVPAVPATDATAPAAAPSTEDPQSPYKY